MSRTLKLSLLVGLLALGCFGLVEEDEKAAETAPGASTGGQKVADPPTSGTGGAKNPEPGSGGKAQNPEIGVGGSEDPPDTGMGGATCESVIEVTVPAEGCILVRCMESEWQMVYNGSDEPNHMGVRADEWARCWID